MPERIVSPELYSENYFMSDNEGWKEYVSGLECNIHPKFAKALELADVRAGDRVLDIGCGRGELVYYAVKKGARAIGIDYSEAAIGIAGKTIEKLEDRLRPLARAEVGDVVTHSFTDKFSVIFMIEIAEHMYDWQLKAAFGRIKELLAPDGRLVIMTPNYYYEKYLFPIKNIMNIPFNFIKWPMRILRGKYKPKDFHELLNRIFKVKVDRGQLNRAMHVNVTTPRKLRELLSDFDIELYCDDHSKNILSLVTQRWWGREIIVVAVKKRI